MPHPAVMKVFIQNCKTQEFYGDDTRWVATRAQAMDCWSAANAEKIARRKKLRDISIILTFQQGNQTIVLPLGTKTGPPRDAPDGRI